MEELTISEAAVRYGIAERTIRKWIAQQKLSTRNETINGRVHRLVKAEDVANLIEEKGMPVRSGKDYPPQLETLMQEIAALKERVAELEMTVARLAPKQVIERPPVSSFAHEETSPKPTRSESQKKAVSRQAPQNSDLPPGCVFLKAFAIRHGVAPSTAKNQHLRGFKLKDGTRDKLEVSSRPRTGRSSETTYFLTPEQQEKALAYWRRYGTITTEDG